MGIFELGIRSGRFDSDLGNQQYVRSHAEI
jgi:hypothetical protein